ncbi:MAG: hypothetical protein GXO62_00995 [Epsilonproteobacteria bacterium]|nr:hypothetical protein [Campylobacterota bacterium]
MKVAFPTNDKKTIAPRIGMAKGFLIIEGENKEYIENEKLKEFLKKNKKFKGDCGEHGLGIGQVLPKILKDKGVEIFVAKKFGEGMIGNLDLLGIKTYSTQKREIKEVLKELNV